jgi:peptidoglycan/xylan/chitin deacetylase (PgdA/CDA1 family)
MGMFDQERAESERIAVLTFDDGNKSDHAYVAPILQRFGFGATFFITEGLGFLKIKRFYLAWEEIAELHRAGFEIANHTRSHLGVRAQSRAVISAELEHIERRCADHGIPRPTTFAYPGYQFSPAAIEVLRERGYRFARRGPDPEFSMRDARQGEENDGLGRPRAWDPRVDHPLLVPTTVDANKHWTPERFRRVVTGVPDDTIVVLTFHGVPAIEHPWGTTDPADFLEFMTILRDEGFRVIALRDTATLEGDLASRSDHDDGAASDLIAEVGMRRRLTPTELRCEWQRDPIGIGGATPLLSWVPESSRRGQRRPLPPMIAFLLHPEVSTPIRRNQPSPR